MLEELRKIKELAAKAVAETQTLEALELARIKFLGRKSKIVELMSQLKDLPDEERRQTGEAANQVKTEIAEILDRRRAELQKEEEKFLTVGQEWIDVTAPGLRPPEGRLHLVTKAIREITEIFSRLGFNRVRYPEVEWDWYAFESLNMPEGHPARDEWETFFVTGSKFSSPRNAENLDSSYNPPRHSGATEPERGGGISGGPRGGFLPVLEHPRYGRMLLTPHTSSGQVREMERGELPIRMMNISKTYRRQSDVSHVPMFHQFEGLLIVRVVSVTHLKGVLDFFAKEFFGPERKTRLRPFHFRFTEPSFEIDVSCGICGGTGHIGQIANRQSPPEKCRLCKEGWLELGGAGMVHPNVLKAGGVNPQKWSGFAFGWGVERTYMMKEGLKIDDIRILYKNDLRFLKQF